MAGWPRSLRASCVQAAAAGQYSGPTLRFWQFAPRRCRSQNETAVSPAAAEPAITTRPAAMARPPRIVAATAQSFVVGLITTAGTFCSRTSALKAGTSVSITWRSFAS